MLEVVLRGHNVYKATWTPTVGEILAVRQEPHNDHDRQAHALITVNGKGLCGYMADMRL